MSQAEQRGATVRRHTWRLWFDGWLSQHVANARDSYQRLWRTPIGSLLTVLVIAVAICLPATLWTLLDNAQRLTEEWQEQVEVSVFMQLNTPAPAVSRLADDIGVRSDVDAVAVITPQQALADFAARSGLGDVLAGLDRNPLPAVIVLYPALRTIPELKALQADLQDLPGVELVQLDTEWVARLNHLLQLARQLVIALGGGLLAAVFLVIVNTIRMAVEARRDEIVIVRLVGGTAAYVRRPFIWTALWLGLSGCLLALLLNEVLVWWLQTPVQALAQLYQSDFTLSGIGMAPAALALGLALVTSYCAAWLAVQLHLRYEAV